MSSGDEEVGPMGTPVTRPHASGTAGTGGAAVTPEPADDGDGESERPHLAHVKQNASSAEMTSGHRKATKKPDRA